MYRQSGMLSVATVNMPINADSSDWTYIRHDWNILENRIEYFSNNYLVYFLEWNFGNAW